MRISFIVPCYNVSKTVRRCLDSVYALSLSEVDFEVIAVNDASTDDTLQIVREYAQSHSNLLVLNHLVNRNLGAARNTGLALAKGNYIAFLDSDDEVGPGVVTALKMAEDQELDMVAMRVEKVNEDGTEEETLSLAYPQDQVFSGILLQEEHPFWGVQAWRYLYARKLLDRVAYPFAEGVYYEDSDFVCSHLYQAGRLGFSDACGYRFFFSNPASITHTLSPEHVFGYACLGARMLAFYERLEKKTSLFAKSILEGGSFNLMKSFRQLPRLGSVSEVRHFYDMLDSRVDRKSLKRYRKPAYCWTFWTRFCLRHRFLATEVAGMMAIV